MNWFSYIALITASINVGYEFRRDLMMLQQNSYRNERYRRWLDTSGDTTSIMRLVSMAVVLASLSTLATPIIGTILITAVSVINSISLARRKYKKPLVWTPRACRIYAVMVIIALIMIFATGFATGMTVASVSYMAITALAVYCLSHLITVAANWLLKPVEAQINSRYYRDAQQILASMPELLIIGVTGSYGKTSTKHYLHRILSEKYDVMMTPGSYNTTLGVIRTVREHLKPYNEIFIVEMGAKQCGDIKEICDLVHPSMGIVTAVGEQHLESFKTIENVQKTKFELIDALPADGMAVVNNDFPYAAKRRVSNTDCVRYAVKNTEKADYTADEIKYSPSGTTFTLCCPDGSAHEFTTRLVGECNVSNLMAAIIIAMRLKVPVEKIRYAVSKIEQVEHRLNMKRTPGGVTIIDDAFNSNPTGSEMALDVLASMTGGKRIIVTPGMIELGDRQEELNEKFGRKIASSADVAIVVGKYNRDAITRGIQSAEGNAKVHSVDTFNDAQTLLGTILASGDTVLYENDLPDTFK